jgi:hypothetical protein
VRAGRAAGRRATGERAGDFAQYHLYSITDAWLTTGYNDCVKRCERDHYL